MPNDCPFHSGVEAELRAVCQKMNLLFEAQNKALEEATRNMDRRLEGMNEFRRQLDNQAGTFATRVELKAEVDKLELKLTPLVRMGAIREGSSRWSDYLIMAGISATIVLLTKLLHL